MPRQPAHDRELPNLPPDERLDHFRAVMVEDRNNGQYHPVEHYLRDVSEEERSRLLDELKEIQQQLNDSSTTATELPKVHAPPPPQTVGRYRIRSLLGRGSFGEVWRAFDPQLQRDVAVKILRPDRLWSPRQVAQFLEEGRKLARLKHPGIVAVYDVGQEQATLFIVSEFLEGGTLADRIQRAPPDRAEAVRLVADVADAVHHAHLRGITHRDIKPANILLDAANRPHLADFGVAMTEQEQPGAKGAIAGTVAYMSPEQIRGESHLLDGRTDVYSLGVVLYELLTRRRPFQGRDQGEYREQIVHRQPRPLRSIDDGIPKHLEEVCLRCLAKGVAERYPTAADLAQALREAVRDGAPTPSTVVGPARPRPVSSGAVAGGGLVLLAVCIGVVALAFVWPGRNTTGPTGTTATPPAATERKDGPARAPAVEDDPDVLRVTPLQWPSKKESEISRWEILESSDALSVFTDMSTLLRLGALDREDFDLSVDFSQVSGEGRVGVFCGHRVDADTGAGSYQLFEVVVINQTSHLARSLHDLPAHRGRGGHGLKSGKIDYVAGGKNTMRLRVRRGQLQQVIFNTKPVDNLVGDGSARQDCRGAFGVHNLRSEGVFSRVAIDGAPMRLVRGPDR